MKSVAKLYEQFEPSHYSLSLTINKKALTFSGKVIIEGTKTGRPSKRITFHQKNLKFHDVKIHLIQKQKTTEIAIKRTIAHEAYDEVRLHTNSLIYPGLYSIEITFSGHITSDMQGIYPSIYEHKGKTETIIGTQFESHHAREAFPCIDEPEAKATFQLTLNKCGKDVILSNTNPIKQTKNSTTFAVTPKMSSYLLAFIIGPIHCHESKTKNGIVVRTWASLAQPTKMLTFSVDEAVRYLDFFNDYFGIPYPLEKCDQVALPDFDSGAMENWGLVTYREVALLSDADNPSVSSQQYISLVIAHELSHQWFGNLVTMKWWDDLWLNESFASIMEYIALDYVHPEWQMWEHYTSSDVLATTSRDIYSDIQPVGVKVTDPEIIETLFDPGIVYAKGGRLIKMMRDLIGEKAFRKGLKLYFESYAYSNATRVDLWACFAQVSKIDVASFMTPWIEQPGMPLLTVDQKDKSIEVSQKRFLLDDKIEDNKIWPIAFLSNSIEKPPIINKKQQVLHNIDNSVVINDQASGHYFVYYANKSHRNSVAQQFAQQQINPTGRINLLNDIYMLSRKGIIPLTDGLEIIKNSPSENRDCVWILMSRIIGAASQLTEGDEKTETNIKIFKRAIATGWYEKLGWNEAKTDDTNTQQLRISILALMLASEDSIVIKAALQQYNTYPVLEKIPAEIRPLLLGAAVRFGDDQIIKKLIDQYKTSSPDMQLDITNALSSTKIPLQAKKVLRLAVGPNGFVRSQDVLRWITVFIRNRYVRDVAWQFMEENWSWLYKVLNRSKSFDYFPIYLASVIANDTYAKKFEEFFADKHTIKSLTKNIDIGLTDIAARLEWRQREEDPIKAWFTK